MDVEPPPALIGEKYIPLTFQSNGGKGGRNAGGASKGDMSRDVVAKLNGGDGSEAMMEKHPATGAAQTEEFLQRTALNARVYADKIRNISSTIENKPD